MSTLFWTMYYPVPFNMKYARHVHLSTFDAIRKLVIFFHVIRLLPINMKLSRHVYLVLFHVLPCSFQHAVFSTCELEYV
jgi:hypothetical protein